MPLSPYLSFAGNCADAIAYYQRTLGAELLYKISFGEMPKSAQDSAEICPSGMQFPDTAIAHANVRIAGSDIMMSDAMPSGKASYSGFTLVLDSQQVEEGKQILVGFQLTTSRRGRRQFLRKKFSFPNHFLCLLHIIYSYYINTIFFSTLFFAKSSFFLVRIP